MTINRLCGTNIFIAVALAANVGNCSFSFLASTHIDGTATTFAPVFDTKQVNRNMSDADNGDIGNVDIFDDFNGTTLHGQFGVSAAAKASLGALGVSVIGHAQSNSEDVQAGVAQTYGSAGCGATASAGWTDVINMFDPSLPVGAVLFPNGNLILKGFSDAFATGGGGASVFVNISGFGVGAAPPLPGSGHFGFAGAISGGTLDLNFPPPAVPIQTNSVILNGVPSPVSYTITITGQASGVFDPLHVAQGDGTFIGEFGDTLTWGGITSVVGPGGGLLTNWTITSASGFDYSKPYSVPEPSTFALAALSFVCLGVITRRKKNRRA